MTVLSFVPAAQKVPHSTDPAAANDADEDITIERRRETTRMKKIDSRLLAIARGELEPDDPFGGLIPIYDQDDEKPVEVNDSWLVVGREPEELAADAGLLGDTIPTARMRAHDVRALPLEPRSALFFAQIDGVRTFAELVRVCRVDDLAGLEIIDELLRYGAIELF